MNKDLQAIIEKIFKDPDPVIWHGDWLIILNLLLRNEQLFQFWKDLLDCIKKNHPVHLQSISLNKYIKWEIKGFIAQVVKFKIMNLSKKEFHNSLKIYLSRKKIQIQDSLLLKVISVVNDD